MEKEQKKLIQNCANQGRLDTLDMVYLAKSGHIGGAFSIAEILAYLYFYETNINCENIDSPNRDKIILSKGHGCAMLYSMLIQKGLVNEKKENFRKFGSIFQGHPDMKKTKAIDFTTGSLGQGLSVACGMALGKKLKNDTSNVYCIIGDGELQEGQIYEALNTAKKENLDNLYILIDNNSYQLDGSIKQIGGIDNIANIIKGIGLIPVCVNGHDIDEIDVGFDVIKKQKSAKVLILETIKGKSVDFMENTNKWHGKVPNQEEYENARKQIEEKLNEN